MLLLSGIAQTGQLAGDGEPNVSPSTLCLKWLMTWTFLSRGSVIMLQFNLSYFSWWLGLASRFKVETARTFGS